MQLYYQTASSWKSLGKTFNRLHAVRKAALFNPLQQWRVSLWRNSLHVFPSCKGRGLRTPQDLTSSILCKHLLSITSCVHQLLFPTRSILLLLTPYRTCATTDTGLKSRRGLTVFGSVCSYNLHHPHPTHSWTLLHHPLISPNLYSSIFDLRFYGFLRHQSCTLVILLLPRPF